MLKPLLALLVLGVASRAAAERDTFFLGDGRNGNLTVESTHTRRINTYARVTEDLGPGETDIPIADIAENDSFPDKRFKVGQLVLVLQTQTGDPGSAASIDLDSPTPGDRKEGRWELARLSAVDFNSNLLTVQPGLIQSYEADRTQIVSVPEFVSLSNKGTIQALPWDGNERGGVIAFLVQNTFINDGVISATGAGFRGGAAATKTLQCNLNNQDSANRGEGLDSDFGILKDANQRLANAGGGGACAESGGGGGGNAGTGGKGGNASSGTAGSGNAAGGEGGAELAQALYPGRLLLGGGGGAGHGGEAGAAGGGAIFIRAGSLVGSGSIVANGESFTTAAAGKTGGGGGGGGTIHLRVASNIPCPILLEAKGSDGRATSDSSKYYGPGGGGGGGYVFLQAGNSCSATVTGGAAGSARVGQNSSLHGAQPGTAGLVATPQQIKALQPPGNVTSLSLSDSVPVGNTLFVKSTTPTITIKAPEGRDVWFSIDSGSWRGPLTDSFSPGSYSDALSLSQAPYRVRARTEYQGLWGPPSADFHFTVDSIGPAARFDPIPPAHTNSTSAYFSFNFTSTNPSDTPSTVSFQYSLTGAAPWTDTDKDVTITGLPANTDSTLSVRAIDLVGNIGPSTSRTWNIDTVPPATATVTQPSNGALLGILSNPPTFQGGAEKATDKVDVYVDNVLQAAGLTVTGANSNWSYTPGSALAGTSHQVQVVVRDLAGNTRLSVPVYFSVDTVAPTVNILAPAGSIPVRPTPLVVSGETEPGSTVTLTIKTGNTDKTPTEKTALADSTGKWRYATSAPLADGSYTVSATATDPATNTGPPSADTGFIVDQAPPETALTGCPANGYSSDSSLPFGYSATDTNPDGMTYVCAAKAGSATQSVSCAQPYAGYTADGTYEWLVRATDAAGNTDLSPAFCRWMWDRTPPSEVTIVQGPDRVTNEDNGIFFFAATDVTSGLANYRCSTDNIIYTDCFSPHVYPTPATKDYVLYVRARDRAGNDGPAAEYKWSVNKGLPIAKITPVSGADDPTNAKKAVFRLEVQPRLPTNVVKFYYVINNPTTTELKDFQEVIPSGPAADGSHNINISLDVSSYTERVTIRVLALDETRNIQTPRDLQEAYGWNIDRVPPAVEVVNRPDAWVRVPAASFEFLAPGESEVRGFRCAVSNCVSPAAEDRDCTGTRSGARAVFQLQGGVQEGRNCISVWALDLAGNESEQPARYEWQLDTKAPEAPVIDAQQGELRVNTRLPSVEGSAEPNAKVLLLLDDGTTPAAEATANAQGRWVALFGQPVSDGSHNLKAIARDQAGNDSVAAPVVTLLVDARSVARVVGGGLNCASSGSGSAWLALLALVTIRGGRRRHR